MTAVLTLILTNALIATGLYAIIALLKSRIHNPALLHWLWILVLLKLVTPPVWNPQWAVLPAVAQIAVHATPMSAAVPGNQLRLPPQLASPSPAVITTDTSTLPGGIETNSLASTAPSFTFAILSPLLAIILLWGGGTLALWGLAAWRIVRLQHFLRHAQLAPASVLNTAATLSKGLGLRRCPQVWQVPGRISPMIWAFTGPARIIVPTDLFNNLDQSAQQTLLLHELVHYRRGDHLVRWLELLTLGLYWWHPIAWLVRREIRLAEELACDASVVAQRPADRRIYAAMLVNTLAFISPDELPALATGVGTPGTIEHRLRKIMSSDGEARFSSRARLSVGLLALLILPLAPLLVRAQPATTPPENSPTAAKSNTEDPVAEVQAPEREIQGTVVDETGQPVGGVQVFAFLEGRRLNRVYTTNNAGQFQIPNSWHPDKSNSTHAILLVQRGETHLGWLDLRSLLWGRPDKQSKPAHGAPFRIVLLPRTQTVQGTLVNAGGQALGGIPITVESLSQIDNHGIDHRNVQDVGLGSTISDQQGAFSLRLPMGARAELIPSHPDWQRHRLTVTAEKSNLGKVTLVPGGRIQGRVVDANGKPLAHQRVLAQSQTTRGNRRGLVTEGWAKSDQDGQYIIGGLSPIRYSVVFLGEVPVNPRQRPLTAVAVEGVDVVINSPAQADFTATEGRRIQGKVLDSQTGKPLAQVSVGYYGMARPTSSAVCMMVETNADGSFEFRAPPGVSMVYVADGGRREHADSRRTLILPQDRDLVDVVLQAGPLGAIGTFDTAVADETDAVSPTDSGNRPASTSPYKLRVKLLHPTEHKVNNVDAHVVHAAAQHTAMWVSLSSTGFEVSFHERDQGRKTFLLINADGFATARSTEFVVRELMPELEVQLVPQTLVPLAGQVVDTGGLPLPGARVRLAKYIYGSEELFPWGLEYTTDPTGRFEIKHARVGDRLQVRIDKAGTGGAQTPWVSITSSSPITLPKLTVGAPDQVVSGIVRDNDAVPIATAKVTHVGDPRVTTTTDPEGKFRLTGLPIGNLKLAIEAPGVPRSERNAESGKLDHEFYVNRPPSPDEAEYQVAITLRPRSEHKLIRTTYFFTVNHGENLMSMPDRTGNSLALGYGEFIRRHPGKQFSLFIASDGFARPQPVVIAAKKGLQSFDVDLEPATPVTLQGRVLDDAGMPVANAKVGVSIQLNEQTRDEPWRSIGRPSKLPLTDAAGRFEVSGILRNSNVAVYVNKAGYSGAWSSRIIADKTDPIDMPNLRLTPATGILSGRVVDETGQPVPDAIVSAEDLDSITTQTDSQGRFLLSKVPNKNVLLWARAESGAWTKHVTPNEQDRTIQLRKRP